MFYGYIRVSSTDQNEDRQRIAMADKGIAKRNLYIDKQSGKDFEQAEVQANDEAAEARRPFVHFEY